MSLSSTRISRIEQQIESSALAPETKAFTIKLLHHASTQAAQRAEAVKHARTVRSARLVEAIKTAAGVSLNTIPTRELTTLIYQRIDANPTRYGVKRTPCKRVVRATLRALIRDQQHGDK